MQFYLYKPSKGLVVDSTTSKKGIIQINSWGWIGSLTIILEGQVAVLTKYSILFFLEKVIEGIIVFYAKGKSVLKKPRAERGLATEFQKLSQRWLANLRHRDQRRDGQEVRVEEEGRDQILRSCNGTGSFP